MANSLISWAYSIHLLRIHPHRSSLCPSGRTGITKEIFYWRRRAISVIDLIQFQFPFNVSFIGIIFINQIFVSSVAILWSTSIIVSSIALHWRNPITCGDALDCCCCPSSPCTPITVSTSERCYVGQIPLLSSADPCQLANQLLYCSILIRYHCELRLQIPLESDNIIQRPLLSPWEHNLLGMCRFRCKPPTHLPQSGWNRSKMQPWDFRFRCRIGVSYALQLSRLIRAHHGSRAGGLSPITLTVSCGSTNFNWFLIIQKEFTHQVRRLGLPTPTTHKSL